VFGMPPRWGGYTMEWLPHEKEAMGATEDGVMGDDLGSGGAENDQETLAVLLIRWRERLDPMSIPGLVPPGRRRKRRVSQAEVARMAGISERWYWALENGRQANFSPKSLDSLAHALRLSPAERLTLYLHVTGEPPAPHVEPDSDAVSATACTFQSLLDAQLPNPAYVSDCAWNMLRHNRPVAQWFPWVSHEPNLMRWVFLHQEAREQLVNWRDDWARPFLAQLRVASVRYSGHQQLQRLRSDILTGSDEAREMWEAREASEHSDGEFRRLRLPCHRGEEITVRLMGLIPMSDTRLRFIVLMRDGDLPGAT
jgi:transcriptional regulator with XRE-family HTH domain